MIPQLNRLASVFMEIEGLRHSAAVAKLDQLRLRIYCGPSIVTSRAQQAALLTAVNCAKRAFLGGVAIVLPEDTPLLVPWAGAMTLNGAAHSLLPPAPIEGGAEYAITIGDAAGPRRGLAVFCDAWRGGIVARGVRRKFQPALDGVLGGILAGALGVAKAFFRAAGLEPDDDFETAGLSLWALDGDWMEGASAGPAIEYLPKKVWLLGLGHLGQAYAWTLGLLPYEQGQRPTAFLQDYDVVGTENFTAGLLCEQAAVGRKKTRICAAWLEARGFTTSIVERAYGADSRAHADEPLVAIAGFDSPVPRASLEQHGFLVVVDGGVGNTAANFDEIVLHNFPDSSRSAGDVFGGASAERKARIDRHLLSEFDEKSCGFVVDEMSKTNASSSFVGACTAALAIAEVIRGLQGGNAIEVLHWKLRGNGAPVFLQKKVGQAGSLAEAGYLRATV